MTLNEQVTKITLPRTIILKQDSDKQPNKLVRPCIYVKQNHHGIFIMQRTCMKVIGNKILQLFKNIFGENWFWMIIRNCHKTLRY